MIGTRVDELFRPELCKVHEKVSDQGGDDLYGDDVLRKNSDLRRFVPEDIVPRPPAYTG